MGQEIRGVTLFLGGWLWVLVTGALLQLWLIPATPWHAGHGLLAGGDWVMFQTQALRLADDILREGWTAWTLRYEGQAPASIAAAFYAFTGVREPWVLLPINGVLYGVALLALVSTARVLGVSGRATWLVILPFLFPSALLIYGQTHKDIFSLPGVLLVARAWVAVLQNRPLNWRRELQLLCGAVIGLLLIWWVRPYQAKLLVAVSLVIWLPLFFSYLFARKLKSLIMATAMFIAVGGTYTIAEELYQPAQAAQAGVPTTEVCDTWRPEVSVPVLARHVALLFCYRHGFIRYYRVGNANIDHEQLLVNYGEALAYFPRALQVGLLGPFPSHWFGEASSPGGGIKRMVSGLEMLYVYIVLFGFVWIFWQRRCLSFAAVLGAIGLLGILFYSYTSPNYGALYRYRWPFLLLILAVGAAGWSRKIAEWRLARDTRAV